ncbi:MAG: hypothetical protein ACR2OU_16575 [Thermomicrobiales bacterium]
MSKKRIQPQDPGGLIAHRERFIASTEGITVATGIGETRVSNVPLFREIDGTLHQAVRFRLPASDNREQIALRLTKGETTLAQEQATLAEFAQSVILLVPEVMSDQTVMAEVVIGSEAAVAEEFELRPQRKFTIHMIHHSHYDIGYTDPQSKVLEDQLDFIDYALELAAITDEWPDDAKFRWNIEVNWPLKQWLRTRPKHARDTLIRRIKEGRIEVHALPFSMHTEAYSMDELAQQLVFTRELRETWGIDVVTAMQTDVPGSTVGLATLLTDADIKYLAVAHNYAGISVPFLNDGQQLKRPFYWQAPDGERLLVWYTDTLFGNAYMEAMQVGFGSGYDDVLGSLPEYLSALVQNGYPYGQGGDWMNLSLRDVGITKVPYEYDLLHLRVQGTHADNGPSSIIPANIVREWNATWAYPKLRTSLDRDFFADVETSIGDQLETYQGDWTDWWAVGVGSAAFALGKNRQAQSDIRTAQTLHALADVLTDEPLPTVNDDAKTAYEEMALFDEHTWGAANPWGLKADRESSGAFQWTRKEAFAYLADEQTQMLLNSGLQRIAPLASATSSRTDREHSLLVFNPSSWSRTDLVRIFVPLHRLDQPDLELIDAETGDLVPAIFETPDNITHSRLGHWVRFVAKNVPSVGYRRYDLVASTHPAAATQGSDTTRASISNDRLSVEIDLATASVASIRDHTGDRELVEHDAPFGFNRYVYDRYTSAPGFNHLSSRIGGSAGPWLLGSRKTGEYGLIAARQSNPVWEQITIRHAGDGVEWAETTLTLPHGTSRLHIRNRLHKPITMQKESLFYAFPFAGDREIGLEITGGIAGPKSPHVPGSADHYRAMAHWATITQAGQAPIAWATNEASLVQLGNIHLPYAPFPTTIPDWQAHPASIYSWALNNIWDTNFPPEQGGELSFSYAIGVGSGDGTDDPIALARDTGATASSPLVGICAPYGVAALSETPESGSFVNVTHPAVEINHLAPARDGSGIAIFLYSLADETVTTGVDIAQLPVVAAMEGSFLETDFVNLALENGHLDVSISPGELKTVVLKLRS